MQLLRAVKDTCCGTGAAACSGILADIDDPAAKATICRDSVGNHCDTAGVLTHVDLSRSNMKCQLREVLAPLVAMSDGAVRSFEVRTHTPRRRATPRAPRARSRNQAMTPSHASAPPPCVALCAARAKRACAERARAAQINGNDIEGSLDDERLLADIEKWSGLRFLELGNLPKLTGRIPAGCPAPFDNLEHLGLSYTGVGGPLPECLVNTVHQLEISNTAVHGPLPPLRSDNNLRCAPPPTTAAACSTERHAERPVRIEPRRAHARAGQQNWPCFLA